MKITRPVAVQKPDATELPTRAAKPAAHKTSDPQAAALRAATEDLRRAVEMAALKAKMEAEAKMAGKHAAAVASPQPTGTAGAPMAKGTLTAALVGGMGMRA